jgi:hypothetical protein
LTLALTRDKEVSMRILLRAAIAGAVALPAGAAELTVTLDVPRLAVAEYHRPYIAMWLETPDGASAANLAVWYEVHRTNGGGEEWLKDLRRWWRRIGRSAQLPMDGISGPTRAPGTHTFTAADDRMPLQELPAGRYELVIEAAREVGGRELLRVPFEWPVRTAHSVQRDGERELGSVTVTLNP